MVELVQLLNITGSPVGRAGGGGANSGGGGWNRWSS
jgi:hypothetical protein